MIKRTFPGYSESSILYRSEYVKDTLSPQWKPVNLNTDILGGMDSPFIIFVSPLPSLFLLLFFYLDLVHLLKCMIGTKTARMTWLVTPQPPSGNLLLEVFNLLLSTQQKLEGKFLFNFSSIGLLLHYRIGYTSSGAFSLDGITPLSAPIVETYAPAYNVYCSAAGLDRKDVSGKSGIKMHLKNSTRTSFLPFIQDPFFEISVSSNSKRPAILYRSEHVDKSLSPEWKPVEINLADVAYTTPIRITCYDYNKDGKHDVIGECVLTLRETLVGSLTLPLINPTKKGRFVLPFFF